MIKLFIAALSCLLIGAPELLAQSSPAVILRGVSIVGLSGSEDQTNRDIIIEGGKIRSIVGAGKAGRNDAQIFDLSGRWVMPGLIDTRVHLAEKNVQWPQEEIEFRSLLASGATTVVDAGGRLDVVQDIVKRSVEPGWIGPRVLHCGSALWGERIAGMDSASQRFILKNAREVSAAVAQLKKSSAVAIMLGRNLPTKIAKPAIEAAQANGLLAMAEPGVMSFSEAAGNGADFVHTVSSFATDFVGGGDREKLVKERSAGLLYAWEKINPARNGRPKIDKMATLATCFTPTLASELNYLTNYTPSTRSQQVAALQKKYAEILRLAYDAGVPLIAGSNYSTHENDRVGIVDEIRAWVQAGLDPRVALEGATNNAALALRLSESLGQVEPGFIADLLVLDGNPATDIRHLEKPVMIVRNGVAYPAEQLLTEEVRRHRNERAIRAVLRRQEIAWNEKDIRRYMYGYWQNENLVFASGGDITRGWQPTLDRYLKNYDTTAKIGRLTLRVEKIDLMGDDWAKVLGEWQVQRPSEQLSGLFTLVLQRQPEGWKVVHDHTSLAGK